MRLMIDVVWYHDLTVDQMRQVIGAALYHGDSTGKLYIGTLVQTSSSEKGPGKCWIRSYRWGADEPHAYLRRVWRI